MRFISYAQNFEDVMLWRALKHVERGFYIDVGANDPEIDSVTKAFYDYGWRGINIEPIGQWFHRLEEMRLRDINLQVGAGAQKGELVIYELPDTGLSTIDKATAERHEDERGYTKLERVIPVETLTAICQYFHVAPIHFLKIDVEGAEKDVIQGIDLSIIRPWIIVVESTLPNTQDESFADWDPILRSAHYEYVFFDGLNRYYLAREHLDLKERFHAPPNYFDEFISSRQYYAELKAEEAEREAHAAESRAQEMEERACAAESRAQELEERTHAAESRAQELEERARVAEDRAQEQEERARAAESRAQEQEERAHAAESRAQEQEERAHAAEDRAQEQEERAHAAEAHAQENAVRIEELGCQTHYWWQQATNALACEQALRESLSWKLTGPLRLGLDVIRGVARRENFSFANGFSMRRVLVKALGNPGLVAVVHSVLKPFPPFHAYLTRKVTNVVIGNIDPVWSGVSAQTAQKTENHKTFLAGVRTNSELSVDEILARIRSEMADSRRNGEER